MGEPSCSSPQPCTHSCLWLGQAPGWSRSVVLSLFAARSLLRSSSCEAVTCNPIADQLHLKTFWAGIRNGALLESQPGDGMQQRTLRLPPSVRSLPRNH